MRQLFDLRECTECHENEYIMELYGSRLCQKCADFILTQITKKGFPVDVLVRETENDGI